MSHGQSSCGVFGIFLGFITGTFWLLLAVLGFTTDFFVLLGLGTLGNILTILIALIGFLAFIIFGLLVFKKAWHQRR
ncbi:ABC transporter [Neobacillus sp. MM2021_6]|uniref:ABC transporter n=1 Tax=Bacillaceae TaxID=186817 RepID=UPI00140AAB13|nr:MULTISPECIES: ABC transporter [Bacillaceae]MBO0961705.1 ABC transporter [Neobacillus sp. MM2021_6]NHC18296.1 ABC transporter [Bacillus sp. MM2020_4]